MSYKSVFRPRPSTDHREIPPSQLAARCKDTRTDASHEPFCFELFRRAIVESCSLCWHYLHSQYYPLVRYWVTRRISLDASALDDLVQGAFVKFWRHYTCGKLNRARRLADVLAYLKTCAVSVAAEARRRSKRQPPTAAWDEQTVNTDATIQSVEASAFQRMTSQALWTVVKESCKGEQERLVARFGLLAGWRPRDIAERYPRLFPDVQDVYRIKRNLLDRLRRNPELQAIHQNL